MATLATAKPGAELFTRDGVSAGFVVSNNDRELVASIDGFPIPLRIDKSRQQIHQKSLHVPVDRIKAVTGPVLFLYRRVG